MSNSKINPYMQRSFLICALLLLTFSVGKKALFEYFDVLLTKIPIHLRKSFDDIDREQIAPYKVVSERQITDKEILSSLGTKDYIQWIIEDTEVSEKSPVKYCDLFITYYGKHDRVPHVPEECYVAAGNEQIGDKIITLDIGEKTDSINMKLLAFRSQNSNALSVGSEFSRMYFFKVNEYFACTRGGVRKALGKNIFGKYSFFSKVEWQFYGGGRVAPSEKQIIAASEKLISKILPVLKNEHWPDLNELEGEETNETNIQDESKEKNV
jgi:hypothetical protein